MDRIIEWDQQFLLWLNSFHAPWLDPAMYFVTKTWFWIPLYAFLIFLIFKNYKKEGWLVLAGVVVTIVLADQITSSLMKPYFARLRPSQEPSLTGLVHLVKGYRGGLYGFASSHAANTFGTALFIWMLFRKTYRWTWLIFIWATGMTYTRIYLGVHYPGDILVGAIVGLLSAWIGFKVYRWLKTRRDTRIESLRSQ